jgi:hypothetical protein
MITDLNPILFDPKHGRKIQKCFKQWAIVSQSCIIKFAFFALSEDQVGSISGSVIIDFQFEDPNEYE